MKIVYTIPIGGALIGILLFGALTNSTKTVAPESIVLQDRFDYEWKAELYAEQGDEESALDTCEALKNDLGERTSRICYVNTYEHFNDIDNIILIYEKDLKDERAQGDSGLLTERALDRLKKERDRKQ